MILVLIVLIFFLVSVRAAIITALTIPLALLFAFIFLHATGEAANLLSIGAIDFGIIIDGTVVMVENIYRELGLRKGQDYKLNEVIQAAARDVDRPIFYSVAVIIAGYLPIYALAGPAGKLFHPMADTMVVRSRSARCSSPSPSFPCWLPTGSRMECKRKRIASTSGSSASTARNSKWCLERPKLTMLRCHSHLCGLALPGPLHRRRIHAAPR